MTAAMAFEAGAEDYLVKDTASPRMIVLAVDNAVRIHRLRHDLCMAQGQARIESLAAQDPLGGHDHGTAREPKRCS
ncbi:MAG: hypothetical protein V3T02_10440 [Alphaproteobacteria bacterium]